MEGLLQVEGLHEQRWGVRNSKAFWEPEREPMRQASGLAER